MLVKNWMSKNVITVDEKDSMQDAMKHLKEHDIRMLPVMKKGKLVGIVTDRDLKKASASDATTLEIHELLYLLTKIKVKDIMTRDVAPLSPAAAWARSTSASTTAAKVTPSVRFATRTWFAPITPVPTTASRRPLMRRGPFGRWRRSVRVQVRSGAGARATTSPATR